MNRLNITPNILLRNNVNVFGNGPQTMIFAHGFGWDQKMWRYITPAFFDDYQIVLFDYVGSGKSDLSAYHPRRYSALDGYAQDIVDIIDTLALADSIFVGHSVSGALGLLASLRRPGAFRRIVLVGSSPRYINDPPDYIGGFEQADIEGLFKMMDKNYIGWVDFLAPAIMQNPERPELTEQLKESLCSADPIIARQFARATFFSDNRSQLPKVQVPSLIMQCTDDIIVPLGVGQYLHRHLSHSTLQILKATGHCPHVSHPDETISTIKEYLANTAVNGLPR